jgi:hypothetical protein
MRIEWIYQKYLRNKKLIELKRYSRRSVLYPLSTFCSIRPQDKHEFQFLTGFNQHPNFSKDM